MLTKIFVRFGGYGLIPLFFVSTWGHTITLTEDDWPQKIFIGTATLFAFILINNLRQQSIPETNVRLGLISGNAKQPPATHGWRLAILATFIYCMIGAMIGACYALTTFMLLHVYPSASPRIIPATFVHFEKGSGSRSHPCLTNHNFDTPHGRFEICQTGFKKRIPMPEGLTIGEPVVLHGTANEYLFVLDSVSRP